MPKVPLLHLIYSQDPENVASEQPCMLSPAYLVVHTSFAQELADLAGRSASYLPQLQLFTFCFCVIVLQHRRQQRLLGQLLPMNHDSDRVMVILILRKIYHFLILLSFLVVCF